MRTKQQLIDATLQAMRQGLGFSNEGAEENDAIAIATLNERLPEGEFKTCEDLALGAECCETCHTFCPHCEMYLETLPSGELAWICCAVLKALVNPNADIANQDQELLDLEEALGGGPRRLGSLNPDGTGEGL